MKTKKIISLSLAAALAAGISLPAFAAEKGDVNGDGKVNAKDATALLKLVASGKKDAKYDFNGDGKVNAKDATAILKSIVGGGSSGGSTTTEKPSPAKDFEYSIDSKGCTITKYKGKGGKVVIPSKLEDTTVIAIKERAFDGSNYFNGCGNITSVVIPNTVTSIGGSAFYKCSNLTSANIPVSAKEFGSGIFYECEKLKTVTLPEGLETIPGNMFAYCKNLTSIKIPSTVRSIGDGAFYYSGIKSITLPSGLETIGTGAFRGCTSLESITVPDSVTDIGSVTFDGSGIKTATIGKGVREISGQWAFKCPSLTTLKFSEGLEVLNGIETIYAPKLTKLVLPSTLKKINTAGNALREVADNCQITYKGKTYSKAKIPLLIEDVNKNS